MLYSHPFTLFLALWAQEKSHINFFNSELSSANCLIYNDNIISLTWTLIINWYYKVVVSFLLMFCDFLKIVPHLRILQHDWNKHLRCSRGFSQTRKKKKKKRYLASHIWASLFLSPSYKSVCVCVLDCCLTVSWHCVRDVISWSESVVWVGNQKKKQTKKKTTCCFWLSSHFSLSKLAISQHSAYRFSPPPLVKWNLKLSPPFFFHFAGCSSRQTLHHRIYIKLLFPRLRKAEGLFSPHTLFSYCYFFGLKPLYLPSFMLAAPLHILRLVILNWPEESPMGVMVGRAPLTSLCPCSLMEATQLWEKWPMWLVNCG